MDLPSSDMKEIEEIVGLIRKNFECSVCLELMVNPVSTKCDHKFCRHCIMEVFGRKPSVPCPLCKVSITKRSLQGLIEWTKLVEKVKELVDAYKKDIEQEESAQMYGETGKEPDILPVTKNLPFQQEEVKQLGNSKRKWCRQKILEAKTGDEKMTSEQDMISDMDYDDKFCGNKNKTYVEKDRQETGSVSSRLARRSLLQGICCVEQSECSFSGHENNTKGKEETMNKVTTSNCAYSSDDSGDDVHGLITGGYEKNDGFKAHLKPFCPVQSERKIFKSRLSRTEVEIKENTTKAENDPYIFIGSQHTPKRQKSRHRKSKETIVPLMFEDVAVFPQKTKRKLKSESFCPWQPAAKKSAIGTCDLTSNEKFCEEMKALNDKITDAEGFNLVLSQNFRNESAFLTEKQKRQGKDKKGFVENICDKSAILRSDLRQNQKEMNTANKGSTCLTGRGETEFSNSTTLVPDVAGYKPECEQSVSGSPIAVDAVEHTDETVAAISSDVSLIQSHSSFAVETMDTCKIGGDSVLGEDENLSTKWRRCRETNANHMNLLDSLESRIIKQNCKRSQFPSVEKTWQKKNAEEQRMKEERKTIIRDFEKLEEILLPGTVSFPDTDSDAKKKHLTSKHITFAKVAPIDSSERKARTKTQNDGKELITGMEEKLEAEKPQETTEVVSKTAESYQPVSSSSSSSIICIPDSVERQMEENLNMEKVEDSNEGQNIEEPLSATKLLREDMRKDCAYSEDDVEAVQVCVGGKLTMENSSASCVVDSEDTKEIKSVRIRKTFCLESIPVDDMMGNNSSMMTESIDFEKVIGEAVLGILDETSEKRLTEGDLSTQEIEIHETGLKLGLISKGETKLEPSSSESILCLATVAQNRESGKKLTSGEMIQESKGQISDKGFTDISSCSDSISVNHSGKQIEHEQTTVNKGQEVQSRINRNLQQQFESEVQFCGTENDDRITFGIDISNSDHGNSYSLLKPVDENQVISELSRIDNSQNIKDSQKSSESVKSYQPGPEFACGEASLVEGKSSSKTKSLSDLESTRMESQLEVNNKLVVEPLFSSNLKLCSESESFVESVSLVENTDSSPIVISNELMKNAEYGVSAMQNEENKDAVLNKDLAEEHFENGESEEDSEIDDSPTCRTNLTSSGNVSSESEFMSTQQRLELEAEMRNMEEEIARLQAELNGDMSHPGFEIEIPVIPTVVDDAVQETEPESTDMSSKLCGINTILEDRTDDVTGEKNGSGDDRMETENADGAWKNTEEVVVIKDLLNNQENIEASNIKDEESVIVKTKIDPHGKDNIKRNHVTAAGTKYETSKNDDDMAQKNTETERIMSHLHKGVIDDDASSDDLFGSEMSDVVAIPQTPSPTKGRSPRTPISQLGQKLAAHNDESPRSPTPPPPVFLQAKMNSNNSEFKIKAGSIKFNDESHVQQNDSLQKCLVSVADKTHLSSGETSDSLVDQQSGYHLGTLKSMVTSKVMVSCAGKKATAVESCLTDSVLRTSELLSKHKEQHEKVQFLKRSDWILVASGLNRLTDTTYVEEFVQKLGCRFVQRFISGTTHVLVKPVKEGSRWCQRTLKYFQGVANRSWVVSVQWVIDSIKFGCLQPEDKYEITGDVTINDDHFGPTNARLSEVPLLRKFEICCLGAFNDLTRDDLRSLAEACGASSLQDPTMFSFDIHRTQIIIVEDNDNGGLSHFKKLYKKFSVPIVAKEWLLDSVGTYNVKSFDEYTIFPPA